MIKIMKNKITLISLVLIVLLGFGLRFYKVTSVPPALNWDEVSIGYNAYSILKNGRDEWGKFMPFHFKAYGEYKLPAQIYASIPGIAIFGLNEFGVRITPAVYGALTVLFLFFLTRELFENEWVGLTSSLLLAISPWHIQLTRASFESSFSVFWVVIGAWLFARGFKQKKYWLWSLFPFVISIYTYNAARVFTPLFLIVLFLIYRKSLLKDVKIFILGILIFAVLMIPLAVFIISGQATARLKLVSITDDPGFVQRVNQARGSTHFPEPLPRLIHNKVTHYVYVFTGNYLSHFTPDFLFINGAGHKQHHIQGIGELYAIQAPFILIGLYFIFRSKNKWRWLLTSWLILVFIPVAATVDSIPNALRTILAIIPYQIFTALGFYETFIFFKRRRYLSWIIVAISAIFLLIGFKGYLNNYYNNYPVFYSRDWQYGYRQVASFVKDNYQNYDLIVFSRAYGEPHMFTLFFLNWNPGSYQNDPNLDRFEAYQWIWVLKFDKFYFPDLGDSGTRYQDIVNANPGKRMLFIGKQGDFPDNLPRLLIVDFLNGNRAFEVVEKNAK
ncbi:MAG: glycosyltransferase family 39 protein [Candidatus Woesebacteria bacterium]|nr:MAG: glycosyltransferase family 39 protein [Candidatus Woesebacteria bacterium]